MNHAKEEEKDLRKALLMAVSVVFLFSCATTAKNPQGISNLRERVEAFYKARVAGDFREAFRYEHMHITNFPEKTYIANAARSPIEYLEAEILSIDLKESKDEAMVKMRMKFRLMPMQGFEKFNQVQDRTIEEKWVFKEGNWYHVIKGVAKEW